MKTFEEASEQFKGDREQLFERYDSMVATIAGHKNTLQILSDSFRIIPEPHMAALGAFIIGVFIGMEMEKNDADNLL